MNSSEDEIQLIEVSSENVEKEGFFCIKNKKAPGYAAKLKWYRDKLNHGLKIIILKRGEEQLGFIEYTDSEFAWRPISASNYYFIQCIVVSSKALRNQGIAREMIEYCERDALSQKKNGICVMTSDGTWIANKSLFIKNGFKELDKLDRFELLSKDLVEKSSKPKFNNWLETVKEFKGWNLVYADQCPWHEKSVSDLIDCSHEYNIDLQVQKLETPQQAQNAPSGFGTFSLIHNGHLLADHYISKTRFKNILKTEIEN